MINSPAIWHAAALRVQWADRDLEGVITRVSRVDSLDSAKDIILASLIAGDIPVDAMRVILSREVTALELLFSVSEEYNGMYG